MKLSFVFEDAGKDRMFLNYLFLRLSNHENSICKSHTFWLSTLLSKNRRQQIGNCQKTPYFSCAFFQLCKDRKIPKCVSFETQTIIKIIKAKVNIMDLKENINHVRGQQLDVTGKSLFGFYNLNRSKQWSPCHGIIISDLLLKDYL